MEAVSAAVMVAVEGVMDDGEGGGGGGGLTGMTVTNPFGSSWKSECWCAAMICASGRVGRLKVSKLSASVLFAA